MNMNWRGGAQVGKLYMVQTDEDLSRVGNCAMDGRLRKGDVLVAICHSGDCFYDYQLVKVYGNAVALEDIKLGSYTLGKPTKWQMSEGQLKAFLAGEVIRTEEVYKEVEQYEAMLDALETEGVHIAKQGQTVSFKYAPDHVGRSRFATVKENRCTIDGGELVVSSLTDDGQMVDTTVSFKDLYKLRIAA